MREPGQTYHGAPCVRLNGKTDENGGTPKFTLAYKFDEERMIYATYSEGFRPGGVNRAHRVSRRTRPTT